MIQALFGDIAEQTVEVVIRAVQLAFSPVSHPARNPLLGLDESVTKKLMIFGSLLVGGAAIIPILPTWPRLAPELGRSSR